MEGTALSAPEALLPAKPGTACLGCRRRKLKCSREQEGCLNCTKADLPCVYSTPEVGVKRKRGPYKKDKPPRERHLEHLVKYLEPRGLMASAPADAAGRRKSRSGVKGSGAEGEDLTDGSGNGHQSENLVKDALIALTKSSVSERESGSESGPAQVAGSSFVVNGVSLGADGGSSIYPSARRVFEYWHLFVTRVDPITKVVHCPSMMPKVIASIDRPSPSASPTETLLFAIYYIAVSTCTANEARRRFGESRDDLLQRYGRIIETALADVYSMPALESVQAIVLYMIGIRRQDDGSSVSTLFALAVRMAQMIGLHEDPGTNTNIKPFDAELRRRLWWHICGLETRAAEETTGRAKSIQEGRNVRFPANLNDDDLTPNATEMPQARKGRTDMSWVLMRWEIQYLTLRVAGVRKLVEPDGQPLNNEIVGARQRYIFEETSQRLESEYSQHLHKSRPLDLMALAQYECIILKVKMMIECPNAHSQVARNSGEMSTQERARILQDSVAIISITHMLTVDRRVEKWHWFIRGYIQWHSLAIVVAELGRMKNKDFTISAWAVLDPILADWDRMYLNKKGEAAWDHVHALISRARQMRNRVEEGVRPAPHVCRGLRTPDAGCSGGTWDRPPSFADMPAISELQGVQQQVPTPRSSESGNVQQGSWDQSAGWDYNVDIGGFDGLDGFDQIDFQAFDAVFGGDGWQFPSPETDVDWAAQATDVHASTLVG
ncbi:hypothetical protein LTR27_006270 [Elasticomyces elasticus]|nr:hypothetical protein LTR27_006270 [Elasticomyces elasticus]